MNNIVCGLCAVFYRGPGADIDLQERGLIETVTADELVLTQKGKDLLALYAPIERCNLCLQHGYTLTAGFIINTLSIEELPSFLCHRNQWIRERATKRFNKLTEAN